MNTFYSDSIARAFVDEIDVEPIPKSVALLLRVSGAFGGGLAVTALLAALLPH